MELISPAFPFFPKGSNRYSAWKKAGAGFLLFLLLASCAGVSRSELTRAKTIAISREQFAANPFGFELTLLNFERHYKMLKRQRYFVESVVNKGQTDTIYGFHKGKTRMLFYKPMMLDAKIVGGRIYRPDIELQNGIRVGLSRKEFFWKFTDWLYDESNSLKLESPANDCVFTFIFSKDKLREIRVAGKQAAKTPLAATKY